MQEQDPCLYLQHRLPMIFLSCPMEDDESTVEDHAEALGSMALDASSQNQDWFKVVSFSRCGIVLIHPVCRN